MNKLSFLFSLWLVKVLSKLISLFQIGQGSNFPGKIGLKLNKYLIENFKFSKAAKLILVTGTNGKSTTCGLLASILKTTGKKVIYNKSGANLLSGIATTFSYYANIVGYINCDYIVLEVDEATLPLLTLKLRPDVIAVTNLFRDQLDRFGELDTTAKLIEKGINNNKNITIVLNADDARVAFLNTDNRKTYFGINTQNSLDKNRDWFSDPKEITKCPICKTELIFISHSIAHLGNFICNGCNLQRPDISFLAANIKRDSLTTNFDIFGFGFEKTNNNFFISQIGLFNLYNALCSVAIAKTVFDITPMQIQKGFQSYSTIFGRGERIKVKDKTAWIYLIKNPTGTTETLKTLCDFNNARFLIAINDNYADGRDISWLWDTRFDLLASHKNKIYVSGKRAYDMSLRLKYANIDNDLITISENLSTAISQSLKSLKENETLYILPTYTALLEMQQKGWCKNAPL